ncbi:MAG: hypothetical protein HYU52_11505 [Acidobacteria bacterium]|nr:hypothetical protein [Acidobacteriota bacterium]
MDRRVPIALLLAFIAKTAGPQEPPEELRFAPIQMNTASDYPALPEPVRKRLGTENCQIPQPWPHLEPANVVSGHFIARSRVDFAALCSRRGVSTVYVVNGTDGTVIAKLYPVEDIQYFQGQGGPMEFSRRLERLTPPESGFCLGPDDSCPCLGTVLDAVLDEYEGKASETHCFRGTWHTVTSGD